MIGANYDPVKDIRLLMQLDKLIGEFVFPDDPREFDAIRSSNSVKWERISSAFTAKIATTQLLEEHYNLDTRLLREYLTSVALTLAEKINEQARCGLN